MDLLPTPEQSEIIDTSAAFLQARVSTAQTRPLMEAGEVPAIDRSAWAEAAELGWLMLGLPDELGGIGAGLADEVLLFREIGRADAPGPFLSTVLGARVAALGGASSLAEEIVAGRPVGLIVPGSIDAIDVQGVVDGAVQVLDATAGLALVVTPQIGALVDVGVLADIEQVPCLDPTALLQRAVAYQVAPLVSVTPKIDPIERRGHVLVAALLTGITEWARDTSARHAIDRIQFDRPIGVNQAIKHPCADVAVQAQLAYSQSLFAALAVDEGRADAEFQALSARVTAAAAAELATATTVQVLGGMGFTHEHDAQLYVKRAALLAHVLEDSSNWLSRLLALPEPL